MSFLNWFCRKEPEPSEKNDRIPHKPQHRPPANSNDLVSHNGDYLGKAARAKHMALAAIKAKEFDKAWGLLNEQKIHYMQHASKTEFTTKQTIALDASVSENLANILRMEGKHRDAFTHILYWVASSSQLTKKQEHKLSAYFQRAKFPEIGLMDVYQFIDDQQHSLVDFKEIQETVRSWL